MPSSNEFTLLYIAHKCEMTIQKIASIVQNEYDTKIISINKGAIVPSDIAKDIIKKYGIVVDRRIEVKSKKDKNHDIQKLECAYKENKILEATILSFSSIRGIGVANVKVLGFKGLMYKNEISDSVKKISNYKKVDVIIYWYDNKVNPPKFLVSNIRAIRQQQLEEIKKDEIYKGIIEKIDDNYLLVRIGELRGILFRKDLFWGYSNRPLKEIFKKRLTQTLDVKVNEPITFDEKGNPKIVLSHKECIPNYWFNEEQYGIGCICNGTIIEIKENGIIVELEFGFEGFVPISELSYSLYNKLNKSYNEWERVSKSFTFRIIDKDSEKNRLLLSVLQCNEEWLNKWNNINKDYKVGFDYIVTIIDIEDDRMWVSLANGLEASIVRQEYTWPKIYQNDNLYHVSDQIKVKIINIDKEKKSISGSIKECEPNPWEIAVDSLAIGESIEFEIAEKRPNAYRIYICDHQKLLGILPFSEISWSSNSEELDKDKKYKGKLLVFNSEKYTLMVSIKRLTPDPWETIVIGGIVKGTIKSNDGGKTIVSLENDLQGFTNDQNLSINTPLDFKVIAFDSHSKEIKLSHNRIKFDIEMDSLVKEFFNCITK